MGGGRGRSRELGSKADKTRKRKKWAKRELFTVKRKLWTRNQKSPGKKKRIEAHKNQAGKCHGEVQKTEEKKVAQKEPEFRRKRGEEILNDCKSLGKTRL